MGEDFTRVELPGGVSLFIYDEAERMARALREAFPTERVNQILERNAMKPKGASCIVPDPN